MKRFLPLWCGLCLIFPAIPVLASDPAPPPHVTILYTGDIRGEIEPTGCCSKIGGAARRAAKIRELRQVHPASLLVDTGDFLLHGRLLDATEIRPGYLRKAFAAMTYDAINIAEGEAAAGAEILSTFADLPLTSLNLRQEPAGALAWPGFVVKEVGGVRVAVVGLTSPAMMAEVGGTGFTAADPVEALSSRMSEIRKAADVVVVLSHLGWKASQDLARRIPGLDVLVVGHDGYPDFEPELLENSLLVKNTTQGGVLGVVHLWVDDGKKVVRRESRLEVLVSEIQPEPAELELEAAFRKERDQYMARRRQLEEAERLKKEFGQYLQMTPEQFMEEMRKQRTAVR